VAFLRFALARAIRKGSVRETIRLRCSLRTRFAFVRKDIGKYTSREEEHEHADFTAYRDLNNKHYVSFRCTK